MAEYLRIICKSKIFKPYTVQSLFKQTYSTDLNNVKTPFGENNVEHIEPHRLLKVAIVGVPNAGKSSFINSIINRYFCAISSKVHTTRCNSHMVLTENNTQLVFLDTPGLVDCNEISKYNLEKSFANGCIEAIEEADIIGVIHDASNRYTRHRLDPKVLRLLHYNAYKDSFLILNKIDADKSCLLQLAQKLTCFKLNDKIQNPERYIHNTLPMSERNLNKHCKQNVGWDKFKDVFMVSSKHGDGINDVKNYLLQMSKPSPWMFPNDVLTDRKETDLVLDIINSCLYDNLPNEVPYHLKLEMEYFEISRDGNIHIVVLIGCETPRIEKLIMGKKGKRIRNIAQKCEQDLRNSFHTDVFLKLVVTKKQSTAQNITEALCW